MNCSTSPPVVTNPRTCREDIGANRGTPSFVRQSHARCVAIPIKAAAPIGGETKIESANHNPAGSAIA